MSFLSGHDAPRLATSAVDASGGPAAQHQVKHALVPSLDSLISVPLCADEATAVVDEVGQRNLAGGRHAGAVTTAVAVQVDDDGEVRQGRIRAIVCVFGPGPPRYRDSGRDQCI